MKELPERYFTNKKKVLRLGQLLKEAFPKKILFDTTWLFFQQSFLPSHIQSQ